SMQQEPKPRVREDKYRPLKAAEAGLYTGEIKGRLCALVRAQLVRAQHADAAPGAGESERLCQRSPSCAVPRAAEAGLYTGEIKGRLCALVRAQLVRAQ
ncbi:hypothetical protein POSPLADRAFT_1111908, partial [Postia placenta MAD-698-R-SB12]